MRDANRGWLLGLLAVIVFSGSLPATRVAVHDLDPVFLTFARASIAGALAVLALAIRRAPRPLPRQVVSLGIVAVGVVVGFPLLTALALRQMTAARSIVFVALLPLATAAFAVLRGASRPRPAFWLFSVLGSAVVVGFALGRGVGGGSAGDAMMIAAVLVCGLGYAEGALLVRSLGGWQVICWALGLALPPMLVGVVLLWPTSLAHVGAAAWLGLAYVSFFSMLIGFVFWYRGLALGGIASVGQLQLLQPLFGLAIAAALLHEPIGADMVLVLVAVIASVAAARRFA